MTFLILICILFSILYFILIAIYIYGWIKTKTYIPSYTKPVTVVSVILPARNEAQNISECLQSLLEQDYPVGLFEIIVVDDDSEDDTVSITETFQKKSSILRLIKLKAEPGTIAFKKRAIATAIEQAKGSLIITLDADCKMGPRWLSTVVNFYETRKAKMIVSPVSFCNEQNNFERIQSLEFSGLMLISAAAIYYQLPVMCNGANLAYEKEAFKEVKGFSGIDDIASGDDVLLMQKINKAYPSGIQFLRSKDATVYTRASPTLYSFIQQRIRWASKTKYSSENGLDKTIFIHVLLSATIVFGVCLFTIIALLFSIHYPVFVYLFLFMFLSKCLIDFLLLFLSAPLRESKSFVAFLLPIQFLYFVYISVIGAWSILGKYQWKGRTVK